MIDPTRETLILFRIGSIGDTVVALPGFHAVRRAFPNARIALLTNVPSSNKAAPLIQVLGADTGLVDTVVEYTSGLRNPFEALQLIRRLRAAGAERMIYMMPVRGSLALLRDQLFFRLAGIRKIHCLPTAPAIRVSEVDAETGIVEPEASRLVRALAELGPIDLDDPAMWDLRLSVAERATGDTAVEGAQERFLAVNMGGKVKEKDWGFDSWAELVTRFRDTTGAAGLVIVGAPDERERAERLIAAWGVGGVNLCGALSPRESAAALARARLFIGHDSGPLHLAASVGTAALGLFGDYNAPKQWHPFGRNVQVIHEMNGMEAIPVATVLKKAVDMWAAP